jgi:hypothetical protein
MLLMQHSFYWEADGFSGCLQIVYFFREPQGSVLRSQEPILGLQPETFAFILFL